MNKKIFISLFTMVICLSTFAQKSVNNYKYIIVPKQFEFFTYPDQFQTSSLTKFLFNKNGFKAFLSDEKFPEDLANNKCLALTAVVNKESGFLNTKNTISLRDCFNNVIYKSKEGKSKNKEYKRAYHEAIRKAFNSIKYLNYKYIPVEETISEIKKQTINATTNLPKVETKKVIVVKNSSNITTAILYAQKIENGFQLVNTKPEVVFKALKTTRKDVYILQGKNGVLYKNNSDWIAEYYLKSKKVIEKYQIKF